MRNKHLKLSILLLFVLGLTGLKAQDCKNLTLTQRIVSERENMQSVVRHELGNNAVVADWADLQQIRNIDAWASCMNLHSGQTFMVTFEGKYMTNDNRQYYVRYSSNGKIPFEVIVLGKIDNRLFLSAKNGDRRNILVYKNEGRRDEGRRNDARRDEPRRDEPRIVEPRRDETRRNDIVDYESMKLTLKLFSETQDLRAEARNVFGGRTEIADWNDLKEIPNISEWILRKNLYLGKTFFVTRNGQLTFDRTRQYFVLYTSLNSLPKNFVVHDQIGNRLFLGSWYGERRQILLKETRNH